MFYSLAFGERKTRRVEEHTSPSTSLQISMVAGNGAKRSDRIERRIIRSLHFVTFPAAIQKSELVDGLRSTQILEVFMNAIW